MEHAHILNDTQILAKMISYQEGEDLADKILKYIRKEEEVRGLIVSEKEALYNLLKILPEGDYTDNFVFGKVE